MTIGSVVRVLEQRAVFVVHRVAGTRFVLELRRDRARCFPSRPLVSCTDRFDDAWRPLKGLWRMRDVLDGVSPWDRDRPGGAIESRILAEGTTHVFGTADMHPTHGPLRGVVSTSAARIDRPEAVPDWVKA